MSIQILGGFCFILEIHSSTNNKQTGHCLKKFQLFVLVNNKDIENDVFVFGFKKFNKLYFTFASRALNWVVIIGDDALMETAYYMDKDNHSHLSLENGYTYIGKLKEVFQDE